MILLFMGIEKFKSFSFLPSSPAAPDTELFDKKLRLQYRIESTKEMQSIISPGQEIEYICTYFPQSAAEALTKNLS